MANEPQANVLARTPLGAHWIDRSSHGQTGNERFVFYQDPQGRVKYASGGSSVSATVLEAFQTPVNNQFAILGWGSHSAERRFYYLSKDYKLSERTTVRREGPPDGVAWHDGNLRGPKTATYSNLAAIRWIGDQLQYHVFYQKDGSDEIGSVWTKDERTWETRDFKLPAAIKGTSIAAARIGDEIKLYYQLPDTKIVAYRSKVGTEGIEEWEPENFESRWNYNPGASISAAGDKAFTVGDDDKLNVHGPDGYQTQLGSVIPSTAVAAIGYPKTATGGLVLSTYAQTEAYKITEFVLNGDGKWTQNPPVSPQ